MPKSDRIPVVGIIVFAGPKTILVNKKKNGNLSFPKGKRNKDETELEAAWRELFEETGLTSLNVDLIHDFKVDECTGKGKPWIRYFVGRLRSDASLPKLKFNPKELANADWYDITIAQHHKHLKDKRKRILDQAYTKSSSTS